MELFLTFLFFYVYEMIGLFCYWIEFFSDIDYIDILSDYDYVELLSDSNFSSWFNFWVFISLILNDFSNFIGKLSGFLKLTVFSFNIVFFFRLILCYKVFILLVFDST